LPHNSTPHLRKPFHVSGMSSSSKKLKLSEYNYLWQKRKLCTKYRLIL
jgi:hypothetical protein